MKTITKGMKFTCTDAQVEKTPYLKDYTYTVVKKNKGRGYLVRFFDGVMYGEDTFMQWELRRMKLISE